MKLTNVIVQFTITIPEIEVDKESGINSAKVRCRLKALELLTEHSIVSKNSLCDAKITDCCDYPALCD